MAIKDHAELIKSVNLFAAEWERLEGYKPAPFQKAIDEQERR